MKKYLQILVITLPSLFILTGGLLFMVSMCLRSRRRSSSKDPDAQRSVATQVDGTFQMDHGIRDKLVEEAMANILSEEFRKKESTKISQEEFSNLYKQWPTRDSGSFTETSRETDSRFPAAAPLANVPTSQDGSVRKIDSFARLWVEELQRSGNDIVIEARKGKALGDEPTMMTLPMPLEQSMVICESSGSDYESRVEDHILAQVTQVRELNTVKSSNELKLIHELEMFLLKALSNLCQSIMAFSMAHKTGNEISLNNNKENCINPSNGLELGSDTLASAVSTSTSMGAPQLLKGGGPYADPDDFVWKLDIEEEDVESSPPHTPIKRKRLSGHLYRGVQFQYNKHPPALSLINLDPEEGYGWRGPEWNETFGKYNHYKERKGPSIYRPERLNFSSNPCIREYYKSVEQEAKRRWVNIKSRYRRARELAALKVAIHQEIQETVEWRKHLKDAADYTTSSSPSVSDPDSERNASHQDEDRVRSMLTTSSSSLSDDALDSRQASSPPTVCKRKHRHCAKFTSSSRRNY